VRNKEDLLTLDFLNRILSYNPETGMFTNMVYRGNRAPEGSIAGTLTSLGYIKIKINGTLYLAHRLAWFIFYKEWPIGDLDHIDTERCNNAISNLRLASRSQNICNSPLRSSNKSGIKGVSWDRQSGKWNAKVAGYGRCGHVGRFESKEEAAAAVRHAREITHQNFTHHG
jgi:hypothetical protein